MPRRAAPPALAGALELRSVRSLRLLHTGDTIVIPRRGRRGTSPARYRQRFAHRG
jgi:hypothetical protein